MKFLVPRETLTMRILANSPTYRRYCRSAVKYQSELSDGTPAISWDSQEVPHTFKILRAMPVFGPDSVCPPAVTVSCLQQPSLHRKDAP